MSDHLTTMKAFADMQWARHGREMVGAADVARQLADEIDGEGT